MTFKIDVELHSLDDFRRLKAAAPSIVDRALIAESVGKIARHGVFDPFAGFVAPAALDIRGMNYRETIMANGAKSRDRGVLLALSDVVSEHGTGIDVYASESMTLFSKRLRAIFGAHLTGSEYLPTPEQRAGYRKVQHEDVQALSFGNESFDLYLSCDVLEHVPDIDRTLREARRILRAGGMLLGSVPFAYDSDRPTTRARLVNGTIEHLLPPEYHVNPVNPAGGSLVFEIPGWDLMDRCRAARFREVAMRFIASTKYAVHGSDLAGVFLFVARV